jgi:hypothetical protein
MKSRLLFIVLLTYLTLVVVQAGQFATFTAHTPVGVSSCPYADTAATDGCLNAPSTSAYTSQHSDFFTSYALQNGQTYSGNAFTGQISGGLLTITVATGTVIAATDTIIGANIPAGVHVSSFNSGSGNTGTYNLANATGLTVGSETMQGVRRPPWNVAGVDYPVGIKTFPNCAAGGGPLGITYTCLTSGLKDPSVVANLTADGVYSTSNGCSINSSYFATIPTLFCNGATAPTTITLDGYDFCGMNSTGAASLLFFSHANLNPLSHITFQNSRFCPDTNIWTTTYGAALSLVQTNGGGALTLQYVYMDGRGSVWKRNAANPTYAGGGIAVISGMAQTNNDCITGGPGICVQYSLITGLTRSLAVTVPSSGCTVSCDGFVFQNNYSEDGGAPYTQFTGYIGDGTNTTTPGNCLSVTAYTFGSVKATNQIRGAGFPANGVTNTPNGCDTSGNPSVLSSWIIGGPTAFAGAISGNVLTISGVVGTVVSVNSGISGSNSSGSPTFLPPNVYITSFGTGGGGNGTYNLSSSPCSSGCSGTYTAYPIEYVASEPMFGMDGQHGDVPIYLAYASSGTGVIPSIQYSFNTVYMSPNTFGSTGTPTFNRNGNIGTISSMTINNNISASNPQLTTMGAGITVSSVMGSDSNSTRFTGPFDVTSNFIDPTGAAACFQLSYNATYTAPTLTGNVNMLGNGSGAPDPLANSNAGTCNHVSQ